MSEEYTAIFVFYSPDAVVRENAEFSGWRTKNACKGCIGQGGPYADPDPDFAGRGNRCGGKAGAGGAAAAAAAALFAFTTSTMRLI